MLTDNYCVVYCYVCRIRPDGGQYWRYTLTYLYMNRVMTQSHMVNDGVHADQL